MVLKGLIVLLSRQKNVTHLKGSGDTIFLFQA